MVAIAGATYMLSNAFMAGQWSVAGYAQLVSVGLFAVGCYGLIRISSPLYHFVLTVEDELLRIEIWHGGDQPQDVQAIRLQHINTIRIAPQRRRAENEALFDFSMNYQLLYTTKTDTDFRPLIALEEQSFTLKVDDIHNIIDFLHVHHPEIDRPDANQLFLNRL